MFVTKTQAHGSKAAVEFATRARKFTWTGDRSYFGEPHANFMNTEME